jgi:solute carrier family 25 citrate transporter 1
VCICAQRVIVQERGVLGLYRGLTSLLLGTIPKTSVRFGTYGQLKNMLRVNA